MFRSAGAVSGLGFEWQPGDVPPPRLARSITGDEIKTIPSHARRANARTWPFTQISALFQNSHQRKGGFKFCDRVVLPRDATFRNHVKF